MSKIWLKFCDRGLFPQQNHRLLQYIDARIRQTFASVADANFRRKVNLKLKRLKNDNSVSICLNCCLFNMMYIFGVFYSYLSAF